MAGLLGLWAALDGSAAAALPAGCVGTGVGSCSFLYTGSQQTFVVPAGITSVHVVAVGGSGGPSNCFNPPCEGAGGQASADIAVTPGETLYVEVGQNSTSSAGGWNGGGAGGSGGVVGNLPGGGGGGASDVRTVGASTNDPSADLASLNSRLVVAGGGGGGGGEGAHTGGAAGAGGFAGHPGGAGGPGTAAGGGTGGSCGCLSPSESGTNGTLGTGGPGGSGTVSATECADNNFAGGGGGGGGVYGGGGGAGGDCDDPSSGGGGGASGFAPVGVSSTATSVDTTSVPSVTLSWGSAPENMSAPAISGSPRVGKTLSISPGVWAGTAPLSYAFLWQRCAPGCISVGGATATFYTLTAADVGATLQVLVTASNGAGSSQALSNQVGPVLPTPAQLKARLLMQVAPRGRGAKIVTLLSRGRYTLSLSVLAAGRVRIDWYYVPNGATVAATKRQPTPVVVAAGTTNVSKAGLGKMTIILNVRGKQLLKRATNLKLTAKGTFIPTGATAVTATKIFTLKR